MAFGILAISILWEGHRCTVARVLPLACFFAIKDTLNDIEILCVAHDNIVAAGIDGIAGLNRYCACTCAARDLQATNDSCTVQIEVVQPLLGTHIFLLAIEFRFGQQLSRKVAWSLQALQAQAGRTRAGYTMRSAIFIMSYI
jgi:hypothetical protein